MEVFMSQYLKDVFKNQFDIGAAVNWRTIDSHAVLLKENFTSVTCENEMKFQSVHPERDKYTFERADKIADFAMANGMKVRGHTLVWHSHEPDWLFTENVTRGEVVEALAEHIDTVLKRYKGKVYCWDVVNEAISDSEGDYMRKTKWSETIGDDYIDVAFNLAHKADPNVLLFYNDYNEHVPAKRDKICKLIKGMKERGVPIHGVGLQGHWNIFKPTADDLKTAIEKYAELGLEIHITELDVSVFLHQDERTDLTEPEPGMTEKVIETYETAFGIFREYKDIIKSVTTWGVADDCTWLDNFPVRGRKNWPLLFDVNHKPKIVWK
jgi:endo-1,4-beta-xylanase